MRWFNHKIITETLVWFKNGFLSFIPQGIQRYRNYRLHVWYKSRFVKKTRFWRRAGGESSDLRGPVRPAMSPWGIYEPSNFQRIKNKDWNYTPQITRSKGPIIRPFFIQCSTQTIKITVHAISKYFSPPPRPQRSGNLTRSLWIFLFSSSSCFYF